MDKKQKYSEKFNTILKQLLEDTKSIVGSSYLFNFNIIIAFNNQLPIQKFCEYCLNYKDKIKSRDPTYFLNDKLYQDELSNLDDKEYYLNEILNLKEIYLKIDDDSKNNLWDILEALIILAEKYKSQ